MSTLLEPKVRRPQEAVRGLPRVQREVVSDSAESPSADLPAARPSATVSGPLPCREDLVAAAHQAAKDLYGCWEFVERLRVYKELAERHKADARRVLNIAAARWPELIPMVNDMPEWKALLSADLS